MSTGSRGEGGEGVLSSWLPGLHEDLLHPPRQDRSRRSAAQILKAAEEVWTREGPDGFTMAAISAESGISIGGLYSRFNGKQGLVRAVKDRLLTRLEEEIAARLGDHGKGLEHTVREFVACLADADLRGVSRLLGSGGTDDEQLDARVRTARGRLFASFQAAAWRDRTEIGHPAPEVAVSATFHVVLSSLIAADFADRAELPGSRTGLPEEVTRMCLAYLRGGNG
ncbi:MAG TPA: TetR/AcrR family transcriptional regulator [Pseudonocardiaceae bacterium]|jgi:AcrR family transcriptional regulator|nr:TetR/AcrR family transcriptional regulator [Pseudonocardiaceae bacterium]